MAAMGGQKPLPGSGRAVQAGRVKGRHHPRIRPCHGPGHRSRIGAAPPGQRGQRGQRGPGLGRAGVARQDHDQRRIAAIGQRLCDQPDIPRTCRTRRQHRFDTRAGYPAIWRAGYPAIWRAGYPVLIDLHRRCVLCHVRDNDQARTTDRPRRCPLGDTARPGQDQPRHRPSARHRPAPPIAANPPLPNPSAIPPAGPPTTAWGPTGGGTRRLRYSVVPPPEFCRYDWSQRSGLGQECES